VRQLVEPVRLEMGFVGTGDELASKESDDAIRAMPEAARQLRIELELDKGTRGQWLTQQATATFVKDRQRGYS